MSYDLSNESGRIKLLSTIQNKILTKFPNTEDYNVFFFGSFVSNRFVSGESDLDIGILCLDLNKLLDIKDYLEDVISSCTDIEYDIVLIDSLDKYSFVHYDILCSPYRITDYFPNSIIPYVLEIQRRYLDYCQITETRRSINLNM